MKTFARVLCLSVALSAFTTPMWSQEKVDLETITRIRYEGFRNSKVMELASGLMDSIANASPVLPT